MQQSCDNSWQHIANAKSPAMVRQMDDMGDVETTTFLTNGLNRICIQEWNELSIGIVTCVKLMYIEIINL